MRQIKITLTDSQFELLLKREMKNFDNTIKEETNVDTELKLIFSRELQMATFYLNSQELGLVDVELI